MAKMKTLDLTYDELYRAFSATLFIQPESPAILEERYSERPVIFKETFTLHSGDQIVTKEGTYYIQKDKEILCKNFPIKTMYKPHEPESFAKLIQPPRGKRVACIGNYSDFLSELATAVKVNFSSQFVGENIAESVSARKTLKIGLRAEDSKRIENKVQRSFKDLGITKTKIYEDTIRDIYKVFIKYLGNISLPAAFYYIARMFVACGMAKGKDIEKTAHSLYVSYKHVMEKKPT